MIVSCGLALAGCGAADPGAAGNDSETAVATDSEAVTSSVIKHVFVIAMENHDSTQIDRKSVV